MQPAAGRPDHPAGQRYRHAGECDRIAARAVSQFDVSASGEFPHRAPIKNAPSVPGKAANSHLYDAENAHKRILANTGLAFVLYDLRHTCATRWADRGMPIQTIAKLLGHANLRSVMRYVRCIFHSDGARSRTTGNECKGLEQKGKLKKRWRRGSELNRRIRVLQTLALPLGYRARVWRPIRTIARCRRISQFSGPPAAAPPPPRPARRRSP